MKKSKNNHKYFMELAIQEAKKSDCDIPIGCVITDKDGNILSLTHNKKELLNDISAHAEILAIREAEGKLKNWRLYDCTLYVTLEPCPMCSWAILNSRIKEVYFGAYDTLYGGLEGKINLRQLINADIKVRGGILEEECEQILKEYFGRIRKNERNTRETH